VGLPDRDGVLVQAVEPGSPAADAGLRQGDLIVGAAGRPVTSIDELHSALDGVGHDESLALDIVRGIDELSVSVNFGLGARQEGSA
jgi:serine protease Do